MMSNQENVVLARLLDLIADDWTALRMVRQTAAETQERL